MTQTRRTVLASALAAFAARPAWARFGRGGGRSAGGGGGASQVSELTVNNTSGSTQAAGGWQRFGYVFRDGDIAAGTAPTFKVSGVSQPYSWGCQTYHPSGCLRSALFLLRTTFSLNGSASQVVQVWNGGTAPSASARTLTEVYNQAVTVNGVGAGTNFGLNGSWSAWLTNDANNVKQRVYLDGDAGKVWGILTHMAQSQGGTAHGQLMVDHFVYALTDTGGNLGGFWYLPRVTQPRYGTNSPAKAMVGFASLNWKVGAGSANDFVFPFTAKNFTWISNDNGNGTARFHTTVSNNFYFGCGTNYNMVGCKLSTSGTLPAGLTNNQIWFAEAAFGGDPEIVFSTLSTDVGRSPTTNSNAGSGTHTLTPILTCTSFGTIWGARSDSTYGPQFNYFQGSGSVSAEPTLRMTLSNTAKAYWISTKMLPPYDQTLFGNVGTQTFGYDWNTNSIGPLYGDEENTGDAAGIGLLTSHAAFHFYNQTAIDDKILRMVAFSGANLGCCFKDSSTYTFPALGDPGISYTGFGTNAYNTLRYSPGQGVYTGLTAPPAGDQGQCYTAAPNKSHAPEFSYYTTLFYGEPQFLEISMEQGSLSVLQWVLDGGRNPPNVANNLTRYGVVCCWGDDYRTAAWAFRDLVMAALLAPGKSDGSVLDPWGMQTAKYFSDLVDNNIAQAQDIASSTFIGSWAANAGLWFAATPSSAFNPGNPTSVITNFWQRSYHVMPFCLAATALQKSAALTFLNTTYAKWYRYVYDNWGGAFLMNYYEHSLNAHLSSSQMGWPPITADDQWGVFPGQGFAYLSAFSKQGSSPGFSTTFSAGAGNGVRLTEGDVMIWWADDALPAATVPTPFVQDTPYYCRGVSGSGQGPYTFDLATAKTGAYTPIFATSAVNIPLPAVRYSNPPAANVVGGSIAMGDTVYPILSRAAVAYMKATGVSTDQTAVVNDLTTRMSTNSLTFVGGDPKWAFGSSF